MGLFATHHDGMAAFLRTLGGDPSPMPAFVARNFLLDEGVTAERFTSYGKYGAVADHRSYADWSGAHASYLMHCIYRPGSGSGPPTRLDPNDIDECPETFRKIDPGSPFHRTDVHVDLLRVEQIDFVAMQSGETPERIKQLAQAIVNGDANPGSADYQALGDILETWSFTIDLRPVYAGYWQDLRDLFEPDDTADWADQLRDRLGLPHLDPARRARPSIDVLVFRYPVSTIPRLRGLTGANESRPLVPPTVLDGGHSPAFCPAPRGELTGYTIDLGLDSPPLRQEVLHPTIAFSPAHVWRVGTIGRTIDENKLSEAREWHLLNVREHTGRGDHAIETDADLLDE
jgi:hypothetical protein